MFAIHFVALTPFFVVYVIVADEKLLDWKHYIEMKWPIEWFSVLFKKRFS